MEGEMRKFCVIVISIGVFYFSCFSEVCAKIIPKSPDILGDLGIYGYEVGEDSQGFILGLKRKIKDEPYNYENYEVLALVYDYIGDYKNELEALKLTVKYLPEKAEQKDVLYGNLSRAYILNGRYEQARIWLDKADKVNPENVFNRWYSMTIYILKNNYKEAAKELKRIEKNNPLGRDCYYEAYLYALDNIKSRDSIVKLFKEAVKTNPDSPLSHRVLGAAIRNSSSRDSYEKNMPAVMKELKKALELDPKYLPTYITIGNTYTLLAFFGGNKNYYKTALEWFDRGYKIDPKNLKLAYSMGNTYEYMRDYDKAIEKFEYAYNNGLEDEFLIRGLAEAYNNKAYAIYQSGKNLDKGLALVEKSVKLYPDNGVILSTKAELLYKMGKYEEAYKCINRALELAPDKEEIKQDLARIKKALGKE